MAIYNITCLGGSNHLETVSTSNLYETFGILHQKNFNDVEKEEYHLNKYVECEKIDKYLSCKKIYYFFVNNNDNKINNFFNELNSRDINKILNTTYCEQKYIEMIPEKNDRKKEPSLILKIKDSFFKI